MPDYHCYRFCHSLIIIIFAALMALLPAQELPRMLVIGDSISMNYTPKVRALLSGQMEVVHIGENGEHTEKGLSRIDAWIGDGRWDIIHFNWGLHDLREPGGSNRVSIDNYEANLHRLVRRMQATGAQLIWASTTPVPQGSRLRRNEEALRYNAVAERVMHQHGIPINDLYTFVLPNQDNWLRRGNVHFNDVGYQQLAEQIVRFLSGHRQANERLILVIGDERNLYRRGWPEPLQQRLGDGFRILDLSQARRQLGPDQRGQTFSDYLPRLLVDARRRFRSDDPLHSIIIDLGLNDARQAAHQGPIPLAKILADIAAFDWQQTPPPRVILTSVAPLGSAAGSQQLTDQLAAFSNELRSVAASLPLEVVDLHNLVTVNDDNYTAYRGALVYSPNLGERIAELLADHLRGSGAPTLHILDPDDDDVVTSPLTVRLAITNFPLTTGGNGVRISLNGSVQGLFYDSSNIVVTIPAPGRHLLHAVLVSANGETTSIEDQRQIVVE